MSETQSFDNEVRVATYRSFLHLGRAPVAAEVADALGRSPVEVEDAFTRLHEAHVLVLAPGTPYIWMANPFSALPTPFTVRSGDNTYWANCIWDALGMIAMLGSDGEVSCPCPDCAEPLTLQITDGTLSPVDHIVHFAVPAAQWWDDIGFN